MKIFKLLTLTFALIIMLGATAQSQTLKTTKKAPFPQWSISPVAGLAFPIASFGETYKSGPTFGVDISNKINKEVGFYAKFGYYIFPSKIDGASDGKFIEYTAGPRYYFTAKNLKSSIFLEAGLGGYSFMQDASTVTINGVTTDYPEASTTNFGINVGVGAVLFLGKSVDMIFKVKYHDVLTSDGSSSFIAPLLGIDIKL